ncbi:tRNA (adenosine(37)-N6)-threonylcarbamoyltransferase complex dimerization subunit type 1 TsaB [Maribacter sp. 2308TA10-17]|uniref:tRNA (adenosine(37)-N6)-threonylcarbamoyltransferase complex dimerization subunit type 1 TsaB n=1 Tax=Maribacter sp. 2308TA10-17 TaxID=3386276 RepID=UPI0039BC606A
MAWILNLETATTNCSVSLAKDGKTTAIKEHDTPNYSHSEQLHVFIDDVLNKAAVSLSELDAIAVSKGPGSYTGLRIGVSAAKGLCFSLDIPLISIETLKSMASQSKSSEYDFVIPLLDARRMEVYSKVFDIQFNEVRETKAEIVDESSFLEFTKKGKTLLIGSGANKCKDVIITDNLEYNFDAVPSAEQMSQLSYDKFQNHDFEDVAYFEPYYLKDFILQTAQKKK